LITEMVFWGSTGMRKWRTERNVECGEGSKEFREKLAWMADSGKEMEVEYAIYGPGYDG